MLESFRSRLVISNLLITLVGLLVVVFVFAQVLAQRERQDRTAALDAEAREVAAQVENVLRLKPGNTLENIVVSASKALQLRVIVVDPRGVVRVDSAAHTPFDRGSWTVNPTALRRARSAQQALGAGNRVLFQSPLVGTHGDNIGAVVLVATVATARPGLLDLRDVLLVVLGTAILVWLAIGLYFTVSISRPLLRITAATREMAAGRYDTRVPVSGRDEIARLAASFNVMAEQVQDANRVLKDFVANVSHDLRTPLTMISGFSEALVDGTAHDGQVEESAQIIHEEASKMQHMVDDLLDLMRLESGLQTFRRRPVQVQPFVQVILDRAMRTRTVPSASLENRVPGGLPPIDVDEVQIERALRNLVDNALQYTPASGTIGVGARAIGRGWIEISVRDTGAGIPAESLPRIFERFYRTDRSREREHGHSGLGLSIVREIVEGHGGQISVESKQGEGTTFRFTVPQAAIPGRDRQSVNTPEGAATR